MKTILVVDDSRAVRLVSRRVLGSLGLDVLEAENGEDALRIVRNYSPIDAVLLDWNMPIMDGMQFLQALRAEPLPTQPVVVMCTIENGMPRIVQAMQSGANEYVMKPFTEEIIRNKLQETGVL
ncbi:MAG: response regulator [Planctomycetota bacterium]|jgi:two-component system chemotaxis response regulator CheY|nr:response regulator [Planctomycetota bacterium]MDA1213084.1 response regulator [Planctomycetota bacterium]